MVSSEYIDPTTHHSPSTVHTTNDQRLMTANKMEIFIFSTSVEKPEQVTEVKPLLTSVPAITGWNFDLEDCDNILRIEADDISPRYIESLLQTAGFDCRELEY